MRVQEIRDLVVIGYADVLPDGHGPVVVPPVLASRTEPRQWTLPPFRLAGGLLIGGRVLGPEDFAEVCARGNLTLPADCAINALPDHSLWVDHEGALRYQPSDVVRHAFGELYRLLLAEAEHCLRFGKLDLAVARARMAATADPRPVEARALIAAGYAFRGEDEMVQLKREDALAEQNSPATFDAALHRYLEMIEGPYWNDGMEEAAAAARLETAPAWRWALPHALEWLAFYRQENESQFFRDVLLPRLMELYPFPVLQAALNDRLLEKVTDEARRVAFWRAASGRRISLRIRFDITEAEAEKFLTCMSKYERSQRVEGLVPVYCADGDAELLADRRSLEGDVGNIFVAASKHDESLKHLAGSVPGINFLMTLSESFLEEPDAYAHKLGVDKSKLMEAALTLATLCAGFFSNADVTNLHSASTCSTP